MSEERLGQLHPDVRRAALEEAKHSDAAARFGELAVIYTQAMMFAQTLERAVACAVILLRLDGAGSADASQARFRAGFNASIDLLIKNWPTDIPEPSNLRKRLHDARRRRNELVHDFWLQETFRLIASQFDDVRRRLDADVGMFEALVHELLNTVFPLIATRRDVTIEQVNQVASAIVAVEHILPYELADLDVFADGEEVLDRVASVLANPESA